VAGVFVNKLRNWNLYLICVFVYFLLGLPRAAHLYIVSQPLFAVHPSFDEAITRILLHDKLAYIVFLDPAGKSSWQNLFRNRLGGKFSQETSQRIFFHSKLSEADTLKAIGAAHVVLDPFPAADFKGSFFALAMGVPVITFPSSRMSGRLTLALYQRIGYLDLVVSSAAEFSTLALTLAHKPKVRQSHSERIMGLRHKLFDCSHVVGEWSAFFRRALDESSDIRIRNKKKIILPTE
jgi:protein O-GlcNAc transferase